MTPLSPTTIKQRDLASILQTYNDVTERLKRSHDALAREVCRLREKLHEQNKELARRERLAALGQMAAGVAHEIRNPLGGVRLYASLLERDLVDRPVQVDIVRKLSAGIHSVERIVSDILAFAGDSAPRRQPVSLRKILDDALVQTAPQASSRGVEIAVDPAIKTVDLFCDSAQIERALINLILNAIDAVCTEDTTGVASTGGATGTTRATGRVWVRRVESGDDGDRVAIVVEDNGPGLESNIVHRVFDPFFTTKDAGTGLGLAIVHRIAESHGGCIRAGHRRGGGASFVLSLPLADQCHAVDVIKGGE